MNMEQKTADHLFNTLADRFFFQFVQNDNNNGIIHIQSILTGALVLTLASIVSILDLGKISISNKLQDRPSKNGEKCCSTLICSYY